MVVVAGAVPSGGRERMRKANSLLSSIAYHVCDVVFAGTHG
jgi:hypothetical protein